MDLLDHLGLAERHDLGAVSEELGVIAEPLAAIILLRRLVRVDHRPHRAVEDHDPLGEDLLKAISRIGHWTSRHPDIKTEKEIISKRSPIRSG